jgi:hypothetical protein
LVGGASQGNAAFHEVQILPTGAVV